MPSPLADRFMAHLASALGRVPAIDAAPVTNNSTRGHSLRETSFVAKYGAEGPDQAAGVATQHGRAAPQQRDVLAGRQQDAGDR